MENAKKKNGKLFLFIAGILASLVVTLNVLQVVIVGSVTKEHVEEDSLLLYETITEQTALQLRNYVNSYLSKMDYYVNSDVVQNGGSTEEIVDWMKSVTHNRDSAFSYIGYVDAVGGNWTDIGSTSNVSDRDYFRAIVADGADTFIDNPVIARTTGKRVVHACKAAKYNGKTIGLFYGIMDPSLISKALDEIKLDDDCTIAVFGGDGSIVGTNVEDEDFVKRLNSIKDKDPKSYLKIEQCWITNDEYDIEYEENGTKYTIIAEPIDLTDWNVALFLNQDVIFGAATNAVKILIIAGVIIVISMLVVVGSVLFFSIKPLQIVEKTIRGIATGDADLTKRIEIRTNNEIGRVVEGFNLFSEKLQTIIGTMKTSKQELVDAGQMLSDSTSDTSAAITQIIANIESMGSSINAQSDSVHQTAGAVNEIASNIESLNRMIESQASSVTEASAAVEEMIGNINSVNNSVKKMAIAFEDLEEKTQIGVQKQNDVNSKIAEIETESQALQEANTVISGIAEQTNLLAMNAAIEAAHAGEAGKGFSVVADEIRKLSEDSSSQSQTIGTQLSKIIAVIQEIVDYSQLATDAFNEVSFGINSTNNLVREITNAMEEQNAGSQQISIALHTMNDTSNEVKTSSYEMAEGNKAILQEIKSLQDATFSIKDGMEEMSVGARKINETGAALSELSRKMDSSIKKIGDQVDQFKV